MTKYGIRAIIMAAMPYHFTPTFAFSPAPMFKFSNETNKMTVETFLA
ncbi:hypothetical protein L6304_05805 [bacterium]|nr:hypothetical protein [bacterium]